MERLYRTMTNEDSPRIYHLLSHESHWRGFTAVHAFVDAHRHGQGDVPFVTGRVITMALMVSMGGLIFGYDTGSISGIIQMKNFKALFGDRHNPEPEFSDVRAGLIVGLLSLGTLAGALVSGPLADRLGRKKSITIACVIYVVGILIQISTQTAWYQYIIGRYIGGIGIGALSVLAPMYESESAPSHIRGLVVCTYQLMITAGILVGNLVVLGTESISSRAAWQIPLGLSFLWALVLALGITILPESPRYDYIKGRQQRSRQTMALFHGVETDHVVIATAMAQMEAKLLAEQRAGSQSWKTLFTGPTMMYRVVLGATLMAFQQLTGANYFFYYGTTIFQSTGLDNSYVTQIILGSVNFVSTLFGLWLISMVSRRKCLIYGALWMFVCFIIFASLGEFALVDADGTNNAGVGGVMIAVSCLFIGAFASTWGPLIWTVVSEMYPSSHRAACMGVATCANWGFTFLIAFFTPFITKVIGYKYGYIFAGCCLLGCLIVYLFLIESKDRTLEEIDSMYLLRVKPWASQTWTHPQANGEVNAQASKVETLENRTVEGET